MWHRLKHQRSVKREIHYQHRPELMSLRDGDVAEAGVGAAVAPDSAVKALHNRQACPSLLGRWRKI